MKKTLILVLLLGVLVLLVVWQRSKPPEIVSEKQVVTKDSQPSKSWPHLSPRVTTKNLAEFIHDGAHEEKPGHFHSARVTPDQTSRLPRIEAASDINAVLGVLRNCAEDDTVRHEAAELLRRSNYPCLIEEMSAVLQRPDEKERFRSWAVQHIYNNAELLSEDRKDGVCNALSILLNDRHTSVRAEALLALCRLGDARGPTVAAQWLNNPKESAVHHIAVRCLYDCDRKDQIASIRNALNSNDEQTVVNALAALSGWKDIDSVPVFIQCLKSTNPRIKRASEFALTRLEKNSTIPKPEFLPRKPQTATKAHDF